MSFLPNYCLVPDFGNPKKWVLDIPNRFVGVLSLSASGLKPAIAYLRKEKGKF